MKLQILNRRLVSLAGFVALAGTSSLSASAQTITSSASTVGLTATVTETLTVAATPAALTFALAPGVVTQASAPVSIVTSWVLGSSNTSVELDGYFGSATAALVGSSSTPVSIPTSQVLGQVTSGTPTAYTAFTGSGANGPAGAGLVLFTQAIANGNRTANRTDALNLEIDLTSTPNLPADIYTGTLTLQASAI